MFVGTVPQSFQNFRNRRVTINRPVYREEDIQSLSEESDDIKRPLIQDTVKKCRKKIDDFTYKNVLKRVLSFVPVLKWLPKYKKSYILRDLSAGLTLGVMQIPQGMAYGMLTTLPAIYGLYISLVPVLIYFVFGTSMYLSLGAFAIVSLMVGETIEGEVEKLITSNTTETEEVQLRVQSAITASFMVGIIQVIFGILHFDFITIFLSDSLISGFTTGAGFHIFSSQVKHLFGMDIPRKDTSGVFSLFKIYIYIFKNIKEVNYVSLIIGVIATVLLFLIKYLVQKYKEKIKFPIPAELIVVALGTGLSYGFKFHEKYKVKILKNVPKSLPPITYPSFQVNMLVDCLTIAIVSYAISVSIAKAFAKKNKQSIDANQELYAHGFTNIISSFLSCFVASASLSRSLIQENLGSTQLCGMISCLLILLVLTVLAPIFQPLPNAILAAVVLAALKGLFRQFSVVSVLWKVSKIDCFIWLSSFISVILFGVDYGLAIGLNLNLLATVIRASRPTSTLMGNIEDTEIYTAVNISTSVELPGVKIFRFHAPLFYANVEYFQRKLHKRTISPNNFIKWPVPDCYRLLEKSTTDLNHPSDGNHKENHSEGYVPPQDPDDSNIKVKETKMNIELETKNGLENGVKIRTSDVFIPSESAPFCPIHTIILDCSQISYSDSMGVSCLISVCDAYQNIGVDVLISNCPGNLLQTLQLGGFTSENLNNIFLTTHDAVKYAYSKKHVEGVCDPNTKDKKEPAPFEMITVHSSEESSDEEEINEDTKNEVDTSTLVVSTTA